MLKNLPKGCSSSRGVSDVPHISSLGGSLAQQANRLYMLNVRHVSMMNKKRATAARLAETMIQLRAIEEGLRVTEKKYQSLKRKRGGEKKEMKSNGNPRKVKKMHLEF